MMKDNSKMPPIKQMPMHKEMPKKMPMKGMPKH